MKSRERYLILIAIQVLFVGAAFSTQLINTGSSVVNCSQSLVRGSVEAYFDWPFKLNCDELRALWTFNTTLDSAKCYVEGHNTAMSSSDIAITLTSSDPGLIRYSVYLTAGTFCLSQNVTVTVTSLPDEDCTSDVIQSLANDVNVQYLKVSTKNTIDAYCYPAPGSGGILPPAVSQDQYEVKWVKTSRKRSGGLENKPCKNVVDIYNRYDINVIPDNKHPSYPNRFYVPSTNFLFPGIYTCAVTYGAQTAYIAHYSVCVKEKEDPFFTPDVNCGKEILFFDNTNVPISCDSRKDIDKLGDGNLTVEWFKGGEDSSKVICSNSLPNLVTPTADDPISCGLREFVNEDPPCFDYVPEDDQITQKEEDKTFKVFLKFRSIKKEQAGNYTVRVSINGQTSKPKTIMLVFDNTKELEERVRTLVIVLACFVVLMLAAAMVWYYWLQLKLFYRRHFGKYDRDDKRYAVVLSYAFSDNTTDSEREMVGKIMEWTKAKTVEMYGESSYFDKWEDGVEMGFSVETLLRDLQRSHRMVVVLTEEYVNDKRMLFEAQQGFINMKENQMKVIFIRTPGLKRALKRNNCDYARDLKEAIKACRVVDWRPKTSKKRFQDDIEYALPKLNRPSVRPSHSDSHQLTNGNSPTYANGALTNSASEEDMRFYASTGDNHV